MIVERSRTLLQRLEPWRRSPARRYGLAVAAFLVALAVRLEIGSLLPSAAPFITFFPAVILTTFVAGTAAGIAVSIASGIAGWYFFIPPEQSFAMNGPVAIALGLFALVVGMNVLLIHIMQVSLERLTLARSRSDQLARERDTLYREAQHRISNHLQVIGALLNVQRSRVNDEQAKRALAESAARLGLIGKIHRSLHDPRATMVPFSQLARDLANDAVTAAGGQDRVRVTVGQVEGALSADHILPVALILMECVSNAVEHAFADGDGTVSIDLQSRTPEGGEMVLTVRDDGLGLSPDFDIETTKSLGLRIVRSLADQLGGKFEMTTARGASGTVARLTFPAQQREEQASAPATAPPHETAAARA